MNYNALFVDAAGQNSLLGTDKNTFEVFNELVTFTTDEWVKIADLGLSSTNAVVTFEKPLVCFGVFSSGDLHLKMSLAPGSTVTERVIVVKMI